MGKKHASQYVNFGWLRFSEHAETFLKKTGPSAILLILQLIIGCHYLS